MCLMEDCTGSNLIRFNGIIFRIHLWINIRTSDIRICVKSPAIQIGSSYKNFVRSCLIFHTGAYQFCEWKHNDDPDPDFSLWDVQGGHVPGQMTNSILTILQTA